MQSCYTAPEDIIIQPGATIGLKHKENSKDTVFSQNTFIRTGSIIYCDVTCGPYFQTGHNVLIREHTEIGQHVVIGTNTVLDGNIIIGSYVKIESNCYIPTHTIIGSRVFIGPGVTMTNDKYPLKMRDEYKPVGPIIEDEVTIGGGAVVVPGIRIGRGSFIAAGAVVTKNIPPMSLVTGVSSKVTELPKKLKEKNMALSWQKYLSANTVNS
ncbi:acyltransferase [Legionella sp. CNM-1927-20]|uniref:acyltransferase n=1 Tax=Legionella sp. CNM-1927-20 TaxID=3422221 RepID=UPI00403B3331